MPYIETIRNMFTPFSGNVIPLAASTGGTITTAGGFRIHTFSTVGSFTFGASGPGTVEYLILAGGGGGGASGGTDGSGGGGAGGLRTGSVSVSSPTNYTIVVGAGAASYSGSAGSHDPSLYNGGNSSAFSLTSFGGGSASSESGVTRQAQNGGCGGGAGGYSGGFGTGFAGPPRQGYDGGAATGPGDGGGGGTSAPGANGSTRTGGAGTASSISGTSVVYGGGGGASGDPRIGGGAAGAGGNGGGGAGGNATGGAAGPANGTNGLGGGGGGAAGNTPVGVARPSGAGGSGIVIVRYAI